jgi:hypothetical protein
MTSGAQHNNIVQHVTAPLMMGPSAGVVVAYNYMTDMYYTTTNWMIAGTQGAHDAGTGMNLFEGNATNGFLIDLYHGPGALATVFRNQITGTDTIQTSNTIPVNIWPSTGSSTSSATSWARLVTTRSTRIRRPPVGCRATRTTPSTCPDIRAAKRGTRGALAMTRWS